MSFSVRVLMFYRNFKTARRLAKAFLAQEGPSGLRGSDLPASECKWDRSPTHEAVSLSDAPLAGGWRNGR